MSRRKNRVGFFDRAIALVAALLVFGGFAIFVWDSTQKPEKRETIEAFDAKEIATIVASTVTEDQIKQQKDKILKKDKDKKLKEKQRQTQEKKKLDDLKKKQQQEKKKLDDIKKKQAKAKEAEVKEKAAIALRKKKEKDDEKKRKAKEAADKKRDIAEQKKLEEVEKKKQTAEIAKKNRQDDLQAEIAAEREADQKRAATQKSARSSTTVINRYANLIQEKIQSKFVTPFGSSATQVPVVNIQLDESGNLLSTRIVTSSGDFSYDQAALSAVWNSSPLPLPNDDPEARKQLQDFDLRVKLN